MVDAVYHFSSSNVLVIDDIARTATAGEIPLGILTAVVGAPFFGYLLRRTQGTWH